MINASIIGATGYAGEELTRILLRHKDVNVVSLASKSYSGEKFSKIYPNFRNITNLELVEPNVKELAQDSDIIFLALPHGIASKEINSDILKNTKVIDLGADFRLKDVSTYEKWYNVEHFSPEFLKESVYGLVELNREKIKKARLIANPGCYTTTSILALAPLCKTNCIDLNSIIIDAASGVTGAGRSLNLNNMFCEVDENFKAYGVTSHRHTPEIEQELSLLAKEDVILNFTPHLIPMQRGILATCYANLKNNVTEEDLQKLYEDFYKDDYFVRFTGSEMPETKYVKDSNYIDIGLKIDKRTNRVIVVAAIDNLFKGAAGQAVQNMNLMFGFDEKEGINMIPSCPI